MDKFDDFDKLLSDKAHKETLSIPTNVENKINNTLLNLPHKRRCINMVSKVGLAASLFALLSVTSIFAYNMPTVKTMVNNVISFFNNTTDTRYISDKECFEKFNKAVGVSTEDKNIKMTVDNISIDDNFMNIFYTIKSDKPINMHFTDESKLFEAFLSSPFLNFKINGDKLNPNNHNDDDAYFASDKVLKVMKRLNISQLNLPKSFNLEISTNEIFRTKGNWNICTNIDKVVASADTKTISPFIDAHIDQAGTIHNITIDKVSISPFGSQIVLSENLKNDNIFHIFSLFDDKGHVLDVLNTDLQTQFIGKSTNSFEFLKGNINMKYIKLVPLKFTEDGITKEIKQDIKNLPITFNTVNTGGRIVDKIEYDKNIIKISYHNKGIDLWDPTFLFYDADGKKLDFGDCGVSMSVNRQTAEYTLICKFSKQNIDFSKIHQIGTFAGNDHIELLNDQAVTIKLN